MTPLFAAEPYGGDFVFPPVGEIFNFPGIELSLFGIPLDITRVVLIVFASALLSALLFVVAFSNPKVVPGKLQAGAEAIVDFIREQIVLPSIGSDGLRFVPLLTGMFMFVWLANLFEIIPAVNFPATSHIAFPLVLAIISWAVFVGVGVRHHGLNYFKDIAFPPGVPWPVYILLTPIELVSTLVLRPFTLAIRLFANMVAGHILLTIVFLAMNAFLALKWPGILVGIAALAVAPIAVAFELFIASLQAYIFAILTAVYIGGALHPEH